MPNFPGRRREIGGGGIKPRPWGGSGPSGEWRDGVFWYDEPQGEPFGGLPDDVPVHIAGGAMPWSEIQEQRENAPESGLFSGLWQPGTPAHNAYAEERLSGGGGGGYAGAYGGSLYDPSPIGMANLLKYGLGGGTNYRSRLKDILFGGMK